MTVFYASDSHLANGIALQQLLPLLTRPIQAILFESCDVEPEGQERPIANPMTHFTQVEAIGTV